MPRPRASLQLWTQYFLRHPVVQSSCTTTGAGSRDGTAGGGVCEQAANVAARQAMTNANACGIRARLSMRAFMVRESVTLVALKLPSRCRTCVERSRHPGRAEASAGNPPYPRASRDGTVTADGCKLVATSRRRWDWIASQARPPCRTRPARFGPARLGRVGPRYQRSHRNGLYRAASATGLIARTPPPARRETQGRLEGVSRGTESGSRGPPVAE